MKNLAIVIAAAIAGTCAFAEEQAHGEPPAPPAGEEMQFEQNGEMPPVPPDWNTDFGEGFQPGEGDDMQFGGQDGEMPPELPQDGNDGERRSPPPGNNGQMQFGGQDGEMPPEPPQDGNNAERRGPPQGGRGRMVGGMNCGCMGGCRR